MVKLLENQVAIITGAGRGIGRETALMFAEHGAKVVVADLDAEPAMEVVAEIKKIGSATIQFCGSVTEPEFGKQVVEAAISAFGRLDILVNNADYCADFLLHKMTDEAFNAILDIHLVAPSD
ncbi:SDR family NAD(P)-dependent oxidoreductase [Neobacillus drentensis]|uniref:SDR family NAD(P)-dependent oxidoreductase n=1 Tax=Neobacillus drentensis TaxID=220684 RepID=UPI00300080C7